LTHALQRELDALAVPREAVVVVAVSGGADSMALMAAAAGLVRRGRILPRVVHVDHGLRPESGAEAEGVRRWAAALGLPFEAVALRLDKGANVSARAREARYRSLLACAREAGAQWVLTAHHAHDQAETTLMALARGMGLERVGGMRRVRRLGGDVRLARPFLSLGRDSLRDACRSLGIEWAEDPGNADRARPRGAVRHGVLPVLEQVWPGSAEHAAETAEALQWAAQRMAREVRRLQREARTSDGFDRARLAQAPRAVRAALVRATVGRACRRGVAWRIADALADTVRRPRLWKAAPNVQVRLTARTYGCVTAG
jgi:tRNA(Ile)-lysidine synthase